MPIHFESNLEHQLEAIEATTRIFEGAPYVRPADTMTTEGVFMNVLAIGKQEIRHNIADLAVEKNISNYYPVDEPDFSIEMETGTGKTYTYIRTIFQLNQKFGLHKFMIVVPSVAIREGVLAALSDTSQHFKELYHSTISIIEYNSKRLSKVKEFHQASQLSVMVMNTQAFASDDNIINADDIDLTGNLLENIQKVRPIIILDEPQEGMDTENMTQRLSNFNPLFKLRYSATHRHPKNIIHRLTPYDAYNKGLVKKIEVLSIHEANTQSNVDIEFKKLNLSKKAPTATLILNNRLKGGAIKKKSFTIKQHDDLEKKTDNPIYAGWQVSNIGTTSLRDGIGYIEFSNHEKITEGHSIGSDRKEIFRQQIRLAIINHFERKEELKQLNVKPLTLFFIDRVANYIETQGIIRKLFIEEYKICYRERYQTDPKDITSTHDGYFAKTSKGEYTDSVKAMEKEASKEVYNRILKNKMKLISFDDPLEFIFTHSALGVGWDNPNIFTICTLNETISMIKKRQEVGRGLRLCITQDGERLKNPTDKDKANYLTIIANESYYSFLATYQRELKEEMGNDIQIPEIINRNNPPKKATRYNDRFSSKKFADMWKYISQETEYVVEIDENKLIDKSISALSEIIIDKNQLEIALHRWDSIEEKKITATQIGVNSTQISGQTAQLDIINELSSATSLSPQSIAKILNGLDGEQLLSLGENPMQFIAEAIKLLKRIISYELIQEVCYQKTGKSISKDKVFSAEIETQRPMMDTTGKGLYSAMPYDSNLERDLAKQLDVEPAVQLFFKFSDQYTIPTPIGDYTPDFGVILERSGLGNEKGNKDILNFVIETKGTNDIDQLRPDEKIKILCARKHFDLLALDGGYIAPVNNLETLDIEIHKKFEIKFFNK